MVHGVGHCFGGVGCASIDWFSAITNWVENGVEPKALTAYRSAMPSLAITEISRPVCPYPEAARYRGTGSIDKEENFTCVKIVPMKVSVVPDTLRLNHGTFSAAITLPVLQKKHVRIGSIVCEGAPAVSISKAGHFYIAKFNSGDLKNITAGKKITFTVTAFVDDGGREVAFEGRDLVNVMAE
jgi:hypothetical protein